jgi:outer membrane protein
MRRLIPALIALLSGPLFATEPTGEAPSPTLSLDQCLELALEQNPAVRKARQDLRRTHGLIVETRAPALPRVTATGEYARIDREFIDVFPGSPFGPFPNQRQPWRATVEVSQLVYSGGRVNAALRAARITDRIAALEFQRTVADTILEVQTAFYRILLHQAQIVVREQSVRLLEQQLRDVQRQFEAGTVPRFNVLRAEVELANARPALIRAQNALRLSRETLVKLLALDTVAPRDGFTDITFSGQLQHEHRLLDLPQALAAALQHRPELQQAAGQVALQKQNIVVARSGYLPEISVFGSYGARNTLFGTSIDDTLHGWTVGARAAWPLFDGMLTRGRLEQARAGLARAELDLEDVRRSIELEVRQAFSDYLQALELIAAQQRTVEQAVESLRLAEARFQAGAATQLDVLSAQTALTEARSNTAEALHDYNLAIATIDRVTGATVRETP